VIAAAILVGKFIDREPEPFGSSITGKSNSAGSFSFAWRGNRVEILRDAEQVKRSA
jgi:hypothetical protein